MAKSAETEDGTIETSGSGTWVFNRELGMPESLDFKQELVVNVKNVSLKVPVTVSYRRLTDDELKRMAEEKEKRAAEAAKRDEELRRKAKEEGRTIPERPSRLSSRNQPLTDSDKKEILELLKGGTVHTIARGLQKLQIKSPPTIDDEIKAAIRPLLKHENRLVQQIAQRTASKWPLASAPAASTATVDGLRTWTDSTGTFTVEAKFLGIADGKVRLQRKNGSEVSVAVDRLSEADQKVAQRLGEQSSKPSNPFEP